MLPDVLRTDDTSDILPLIAHNQEPLLIPVNIIIPITSCTCSHVHVHVIMSPKCTTVHVSIALPDNNHLLLFYFQFIMNKAILVNHFIVLQIVNPCVHSMEVYFLILTQIEENLLEFKTIREKLSEILNEVYSYPSHNRL